MGLLTITEACFRIVHRFYSGAPLKMKYLNVAEKNDAAKTIAGFLSRGTSRRREGLSTYNKIYEFSTELFNQNSEMIMTSVSGHLMNYEFIGTYRNWSTCNPLDLFDAPVIKSCPKDYEKIKRTLEREVRQCHGLIVWTDCDREGENIGFEIINVCKAVKPNIRVFRARFSEITAVSVFRALHNLGDPNENISNSVDVRQELDLRIGAAFTRLQTLRLQKVFPNSLSENLISYGSCQFPTLGFVVDRYKAAEDFIAEPFWRLKMSHTIEDLMVEFHWGRDRLFEKRLVEVLLDVCRDNPTATITSVVTKPKSKWRPLPLDTVEMGKAASRKLQMDAKTAMKIAEKLYQQGFISYPRTETNIFPKELNLIPLVQHQTANPDWGQFANRILEWGGPTPRQGKKSDQAHPPIHPTKYTDGLAGNEKKLYEFIVRHFLACCSKDAQGFETIVKADVAGELFEAKGLMITERNYLDVYKYEKWNAKEIHLYQEQQQFEPTVLDMAEGSTTAPQLLTEADLIGLMEKYGIGTDATHAEHIATVMSRHYVGKIDGGPYLTPGLLGMGLVEGYDRIGLEVSLAKPNLRAELEADLKKICEGVKDPQIVLQEQISKYREVYRIVITRLQLIDSAIGTRIQEQPVENIMNALPQFTDTPVSPFRCVKCGNNMNIRSRKNNQGKYIGCSAFPGCNNALWLPSEIENITVLDETCPTCGPEYKMLRFEFTRRTYGTYISPHEACLGGCDRTLLMDFNINIGTVRKTNPRTDSQQSSINTNSDSGIGSTLPRTTSQSSNQRNLNGWLVANNERNSDTNHSLNNQNNAPVPPQNGNNFSHFSNSNTSRNFDNTENSNRGDITAGWGRQSNNTNEFRPPRSASHTTSTNVSMCNCNQPARQFTVRKEGPNIGRLFYKCAVSKENGGCDFFTWDEDPNQPSTSSRPQNVMMPPRQNSNLNLPLPPNTSFLRPPTASNNNRGPTEQIKCICNQPAVKRTVQKDTPNKGRSFYCCAKPQGSQCNFFKWSDEVDPPSSGGGGGDGDDWGGGDGGHGGGWTAPWGNSSNTNNWSMTKKKRGRGGSGSSRGRGASTNNKKRKFGNMFDDDSGQPSRAKRKCGICGQEGHIRSKCPNK